MMNPDAKARIEGGKTLAFNSALAVELATLAHGRVLGLEKARRLASKIDATADFEPYLNPPLQADSGGDRLAQALQIVRLIGGAAGEEMCRRDYDGEWAILVRAFQNGLTSGRQPGRSADGTLEDLFVECGRHSDGIVSAALPDGFENAPKEAAIRLIGIVTDAFAGGMEEALA